jgi:hypothetical protein
MGNDESAIKAGRQNLFDVLSSHTSLELRFVCRHGTCKKYADLLLEVNEYSVTARIGELDTNRGKKKFTPAHDGDLEGHWETGTATLALVRKSSKKTTYLRLTFESPTKLTGSITKQRHSGFWPAYERQLHVHIQ